MPHKKYLHLPTIKKDIIAIVIVTLFFFLLFCQFDTLEVIYNFSRTHESWELDELIPLGAILTLSLLVFSYRRIKELGEIAYTLEQLSLLDPLTNLANRRSCQIKVNNWCKKAAIKGKSFNLFQLDLDNFKQVNDLYGESVGDDAIVLVSQIIKNNLPQKAEVCRWLDDNFIIITPSKIDNTAHAIANELHEKISGQIMPSTLSITCSVGYAVWQEGNNSESMFQQVEEALMQVKDNGGNSVKGAV
ncbi:MAG: GGDEF domain-containing protein [Thalassotalea sp.]